MVNFDELYIYIYLQKIRDSSITVVNLSRKNINDTIAKELADIFKLNTSIKKVYLIKCNIGPNGAKALAEALKMNSSIREVHLGENNIGPRGAQALANALKMNSSIREVHLGENNIGPRGAEAFVDVLKVNSTITTLALDGNNIGEDGAVAFIDALKFNSTITDINRSEFRKELSAKLIYSAFMHLEDNKAIDELSLIFRKEMHPLKIEARERLPPEMLIKIQQYSEKTTRSGGPLGYESSYFTGIEKRRYLIENTQQIQKENNLLKDISNTYNEYLSFNPNKRVYIPRKLLLLFIEHGGMSFNFRKVYANEDMKNRVIEKLRRIVVLEYINVIERLNMIPIKIMGDYLQFEEIERRFFENYKKIILNNIIQSNQTKIKRKSMSEIIRELEQNQKKLQQKQLNKQQKQTLNKTIQELRRFKNIQGNNQKLQKMKLNKLSMQQNNQMKKKILFYMLPDLVIQKYFDPIRKRSKQKQQQQPKIKDTVREIMELLKTKINENEKSGNKGVRNQNFNKAIEKLLLKKDLNQLVQVKNNIQNFSQPMNQMYPKNQRALLVRSNPNIRNDDYKYQLFPKDFIDTYTNKNKIKNVKDIQKSYDTIIKQKEEQKQQKKKYIYLDDNISKLIKQLKDLNPKIIGTRSSLQTARKILNQLADQPLTRDDKFEINQILFNKREQNAKLSLGKNPRLKNTAMAIGSFLGKKDEKPFLPAFGDKFPTIETIIKQRKKEQKK
jgi:hypothetical protein